MTAAVEDRGGAELVPRAPRERKAVWGLARRSTSRRQRQSQTRAEQELDRGGVMSVWVGFRSRVRLQLISVGVA